MAAASLSPKEECKGNAIADLLGKINSLFCAVGAGTSNHLRGEKKLIIDVGQWRKARTDEQHFAKTVAWMFRKANRLERFSWLT